MKLIAVPLLLASLWTSLPSLGASPTSDPVGALALRFPGSSDTVLSLPLLRAALVEATVATRQAGSLTLSADIPTIPTEGAFALVMSGPLEGATLPVIAAAGRGVTLTTTDVDLSTLRTSATNGASADVIAIIPYWTLDTVFPAGAGVNASANAVTRKTEILLYDATQTGINRAASATFFYFAGTTAKAAGWYQVGNTATTKGTQVIPPHSYLVVRHNVATDTSLLLTGAVQMSAFRIPVGVRALNTAQDNLVALPVPVPTTLGDSALFSSGAFAASTNAVTRTDELLVYDNTAIGQNKSPSATYFYFAGNTSKAAGWYKVGDTTTSASGVLLKPGEGYIIRKAALAALRVDTWTALPAYLK